MKLGILSVILLVVSAAGASSVQIQAADVCAEIHGKKANVDLLDSCKNSYQEFKQQQVYLGVAEMTKVAIKKNKSALALMNKVAVDRITQAQNAKVLVTEGATAPKFGFDNGVGGGVSCTAAYDYAQSDEFPPVIKGVYDCKVTSSVWINYTDNTCSGETDVKVEQQELEVNFLIRANGKIIKSSISTRPLVLISSCAG